MCIRLPDAILCVFVFLYDALLLSLGICLVILMYVSFNRYCKLYKKTDPKLFVEDLPGVTIVKPLMGIDPFLETNLTSHFTMKYPKVSVITYFSF